MKIPIACSLTAAEAPDRLAEWQAVLGSATAREETAGGYRLRFPPDTAFAGRLAELAAREIECCAFFTFAVALLTEGIVLDVGAPEEARVLVGELFGPAADA